MSNITRFSHSEAVQTVVDSFYNNTNFGEVTKPKSTFFRLSHYLPRGPNSTYTNCVYISDYNDCVQTVMLVCRKVLSGVYF